MTAFTKKVLEQQQNGSEEQIGSENGCNHNHTITQKYSHYHTLQVQKSMPDTLIYNQLLILPSPLI